LRHRCTICTVLRLAGRFDLSLPRRHLPFRSVCFLRTAVSSDTSVADSTHGVHQRFPSIDITSGVHSRTSRRLSFGALRAKQYTRSILVVPPDSDGLLLPRLRRSVAPCSQSLGSPCFNPRVYDTSSYATVAGSPLRRMPFEAFPSQVAVARHRALCPLAVVQERRPATTLRWCGRHLDHSTSGPCSTCEAAANAPPLPVECCPLLPWASRSRVCLVRPAARQSYGHSAVGQADGWGLLVHPERTQGQQPPSPMVLIGSAEQSRRAARSEERRSQRRPTFAFASATRFVLVGGAARGELLVRRRFGIRRHRPRLPCGRFSAHNTQAILSKSVTTRLPERP